MTDRLQIRGPFGNISAEMLLPLSFDKEHDRCELVILMHGFLGSMKAAPLGFLSRMLVKHGYAVLRFDFDGYGKSEGAQQENTVPKMIEDAKAVWEYASDLSYVDQIILLGHSQGGVVAGMLAGRLEKAGTPPDGLILLAPASILKEYASKGRFFSVRCDAMNPPETINVYGFKMGREYILSAQTLPIEEESSWYSGPVCLLHGTWDPIVPVACSERYKALWHNCEFHLIRKTEHLFLFHWRNVLRLILEFVKTKVSIKELIKRYDNDAFIPLDLDEDFEKSLEEIKMTPDEWRDPERSFSCLRTLLVSDVDFKQSWKAIGERVFIGNPNEDVIRFPEKDFQPNLTTKSFLGGFVFDDVSYECLRECLLRLGEKEMIISGGFPQWPILHLRISLENSWKDILKMGFAVMSVLNTEDGFFRLFGPRGDWGKISVNGIYPNTCDIVGFADAKMLELYESLLPDDDYKLADDVLKENENNCI